MNTIFIDIDNFSEEDKKETGFFEAIKNKMFKISITKDFTNNEFNKNIFLKIDENFLDSVLDNKMKLNKRIFEFFIKNEYKKEKELFIVFSKYIDKNKEYKKCINDLFKNVLGKTLKIHEIIIQNDMLKHDTIYIDNMLKKNNIKISKANVLIAINNIDDFKKDKVIEYIKKYRYVDILRLDGISKAQHKKLLDIINNINDEYGTTIEIIQRRNISEYDMYVFYSNIDSEKFKDHYILNNNAKIIDTKDEEQDTLNLAFRMYNKNKYELEALFNRINANMDRFSKNKLGGLYINKR